MISYVFIDPDADERNSLGIHFLKDKDGRIVYGCLEWEIIWDNFSDVLNAESGKVKPWSKDENLIPASVSDLERVGHSEHINGQYDWETMEFHSQ